MRSFKTFLAEQDQFGKNSTFISEQRGGGTPSLTFLQQLAKTGRGSRRQVRNPIPDTVGPFSGRANPVTTSRNKPSTTLQSPGQMPATLGGGGGGGGQNPFKSLLRFGREALKSTKKNPLQFPFTLIKPGGGRRTAAKIASLPVAPVGGVAAVSPILDKDVNEYLQSAGYDPEVSVTPAQSAAAYGELALKNPEAAFSLATSKPAMKKYVGPAIVGTTAGLATRNPLVPVVAGTPPGVAARRAIVDPIASAAGAKDIQTGENPIAQDAAREYTNIIRRYADAEQKKVDMRRTRKQGIKQAINPYYVNPIDEPNRSEAEIDPSLKDLF